MNSSFCNSPVWHRNVAHDSCQPQAIDSSTAQMAKKKLMRSSWMEKVQMTKIDRVPDGTRKVKVDHHQKTSSLVQTCRLSMISILILSSQSTYYSASACHISSKSDHQQWSYDFLSIDKIARQQPQRRSNNSGLVFGDVTCIKTGPRLLRHLNVHHYSSRRNDGNHK